MRAIGFGVALTLAVSSGPAIARPIGEAPQASGKVASADRRAFSDAYEAYRAKNCKAALALLEPRLKPGAAVDTPEKVVGFGYMIAALCEYERNDSAAAYRYELTGTALNEAPDFLWRMRLGQELEDKKLEPAIVSIEAMTQGRGAALNAIPVRWFYALDRDLKKQKLDALRVRLLRILSDNSYDPDELFVTGDGFRQSYAELLYDGGDKAGAAAQVRQIERPMIVLELSFDPRFRTMVPPDFDLRAGVERQLADAREQMLRHPDLLEPMTMAADALRQLGRPGEALTLLETARAKGKLPASYADADEQLNWWWNALARTHMMLGNYDQAVAALREGAKLDETGLPNVSQLINLAEAQNSFGKPAEALATLAPFDSSKVRASPYGDMEMRFARGCAYALTGNLTAAAADRAFAEAHDADHPEALADLLLCMNDMDAAAAAFIRRLEDPDRRARALMQLSDFDRPPVVLPTDPIVSRLPALKARADVQAAIARAGGIRRIPLQRSEL